MNWLNASAFRNRLIAPRICREYYGTVEWSVRSICTGYLGWFDGNPTKLGHMATKEAGKRQMSMMGGPALVLCRKEPDLKRGERRSGLQSFDLLLACRKETEKASVLKADTDRTGEGTDEPQRPPLLSHMCQTVKGRRRKP